MTITFQCKKCGKKYKVSDDKGGRKIKCRQCEAVMKIPAAESDDFLSGFDDAEMEYTPPTRRRKKSKPGPEKKKSRKSTDSNAKQGPIIAIVVVALLLVGGGGFLAIWGMPGGKVLKAITDKADKVVNSAASSSENGAGAPSTADSEVKRMKEVARAFHNYHDSWTRFPPADAHLVDGKPMLSWRVHMLPFLGHKELYEQFNLQEPWDSPHNKALLEKMPEIYHCDGVTQPGFTSLMTFSGKDTPFTGGQGPRMRNFTDGSSNVILLVQAGPDKAVPWTQPVDLPFNKGNPITALGQAPRGAFLCAMADGSIRKINPGMSAQTLSLAIQPSDGTPLPIF